MGVAQRYSCGELLLLQIRAVPLLLRCGIARRQLGLGMRGPTDVIVVSAESRARDLLSIQRYPIDVLAVCHLY